MFSRKPTKTISFILVILLTMTSAHSKAKFGLSPQGLFLETSSPIAMEDILAKIPRKLRRLGWRLTQLDEGTNYYKLSPRRASSLTFTALWNLSYAVRELESIRYSDPIFISSKSKITFGIPWSERGVFL